MSFDTVSFEFLPAFLNWLAVITLGFVGVSILMLAGSLIYLGGSGPVTVVKYFGMGLTDWFTTSVSRVWAISLLTIRESVRKRALLVFVVFAILFMFAGWFITDVNADQRLQVRVYVSFVLKAISWLILPVVLLLSCWGLPDDIKARSLHTVVTKPVHRLEVVLGRIFGYFCVGMFVLLIMSGVGYVWMIRQIRSDIRDKMVARVPVYGSISFRDRLGKKAESGVNTGDTWMFRSYIEGGTKARAIWDFQDKSLSTPQDSLKLESNFNVFRIKKGNIDRGILAQLVAVNEAKNLRAPLVMITKDEKNPDTKFEVREFRDNIHLVQRKLKDQNGVERDLYADFVEDGHLQIEVLCLTGQQFLGMARPDLFIRLPDHSFFGSYAKGVLGIAIMMFMVTVLGVVSSCFLKGPVATLFTFFVLLIGRVGRGFIDNITTSASYRGGLIFESIYRIGTHLNPEVEMKQTVGTNIMQGVDSLLMAILWVIRFVFPDFSNFNMVDYVANGYDVPWRDSILPCICLMFAYVIPWILVGQYSLKYRELETR